MELIFIRHTSVDVPPGTCYGQTDVPLRSTFPEEADAVKEKLKGLSFDAVFCSPLSRCKKLAQHCTDQPLIIDDRLKELNFGEWEMQPFDNIADPTLEEWYADYMHVRTRGGESFLDQHMRLHSFLNDLIKQDYQRVAIFTHGGILMHAMIIFGLARPDQIREKEPPYGGILVVNSESMLPKCQFS